MANKNVGNIIGKLIATRHLDDLGRLVIPSSVRDDFNWGE